MDKIALIKEMKKRGVYAADFIATEKIPFDPELRKSCTPKRCQSFGKNWGCPPDVGEINTLIAKAKSYDSALVYETVYQLEDSFDFEGMQEGGVRHKQITNEISGLVKNKLGGSVLQLSVTLAANRKISLAVFLKKQFIPFRHMEYMFPS